MDVGDSDSEDSDVTVDDFSRNVSICSEGLLSEDDDNPVIENIKSPNVSTRKVPFDLNESQLSRHSMGLQVSMTSNDTHNATDTADDTENSHNASGLTNGKNRTAQSEDGINDEKSIGLQCLVESNPEDDDTQDKHKNNMVKHKINQSDDESFFSAASDYNDDTGKEKSDIENSISQHSIGLQASMETIETSDTDTNDHIQQNNVDVPDKHSIGLQASFESSENEEYGAPQSKNSAGILKRENKVESAIDSNTDKHTSNENHARENSNKKPITDESNLDEDIMNLSGIMTSKLKINHGAKLSGPIITDDDDFLPTQKSSKKSKSKKATIKAKIDELVNLDLDSDDLDLDSVLPIPKSTAKTKKGKKQNKKSTKKTEETNNYKDPKINKTTKKSKTSKLQIDLDISDSVDICPSQHTVTDGPEKSKKSKTPKLHIDLDISDYDDDPEISKAPEPIVNSSKKRSKDLPVHSHVDSIQSYEDELPDVSTSPHPSFSQPRVDIVSLLSDSSEDDDAMENFFSKMKTPGKSQVQPSYNDNNDDDYDDNNFIVPDDMVSSSESDDSLFYKKSLVDTPASRPKKSSHKYNTSSEDSDISTPGSYRPKIASTTSNDTSVFSTPGSSKPNRNTSAGSQDTSNEVLGVSTPHSYFKTPKLPGKTPKSAGTPHIDNTDLGRSLTDRLFKTKVSGTLSSLAKPTVKSKPTVPQSTGVINKTKKVVPDVVRSRSSEYRPSTYSFLKSLSTNVENQRRHPDALEYVKQFKKKKEELTMRLVKLYNETVFDSKLPENLEVIWNPRLLKTAGYCAYKRNRVKQDDRTCRIELSGKVCDSSERVRDTLIHEMCHAAVWLLNGVNDGHGRFWKYWARKSNIAHPELPIIQRCHSYEINTKFTYKCVECGYQIGRHSKSLDTTKKVCGYCHGQFELIVNNKDGTPRKPRAPSTPNKFALFVKDNYGKQKQLNKGAPHKDIMNILSAEFASKSSI
ncbi:unnamed protein product [Owenia fusiformis]|uniref:SprT-like domain-containing protein n=1 Tax=Owenia fusiformis TaxID=6347 RepID=A0A8S4N8H7_OWEFU|nr:unnamed protein product [Owenia fusiformis]